MSKYGWLPDTPDQRDFRFRYRRTRPVLAEGYDLRKVYGPPCYDQTSLGSCTANAAAYAHAFAQQKQTRQAFAPSRLFTYYATRLLEGTESYDSGASIRDTMKTLAKSGTPPEDIWPYDVEKFSDVPPEDVFMEAEKHQSLQYFRVPQRSSQMFDCLDEGYPFVFGFSVYESFESDEVARTGVVPMPRRREAMLGGHAVVCVGVRNSRWIVRNSWGEWGDHGYFYMPMEYLTRSSLSSDFWTLRLVEAA